MLKQMLKQFIKRLLFELLYVEAFSMAMQLNVAKKFKGLVILGSDPFYNKKGCSFCQAGRTKQTCLCHTCGYVYIEAKFLQLGLSTFRTVLAHELAHLTQDIRDVSFALTESRYYDRHSHLIAIETDAWEKAFKLWGKEKWWDQSLMNWGLGSYTNLEKSK
jgi:hypothetical protein